MEYNFPVLTVCYKFSGLAIYLLFISYSSHFIFLYVWNFLWDHILPSSSNFYISEFFENKIVPGSQYYIPFSLPPPTVFNFRNTLIQHRKFSLCSWIILNLYLFSCYFLTPYIMGHICNANYFLVSNSWHKMCHSFKM